MSSLIVEVCKIREINEHPNADRLEVAKVKGWSVIVGKGEFQPGDLVVYVPPDSILPEAFIERFNIGYLKNNAGRVGTIKLRGIYSYGLVVPNEDGHKDGADVVDFYGITKWEPYVPKNRRGKRKRKNGYVGENKYFHKYTDIENIRNFDDILEDEEPVIITEKIHGTNFRVGWVPREVGKVETFIRHLFKLEQPYQFIIGSRNVQFDKLDEPTFYGENVYTKIAQRYGLRRLPKGYVVYGEIYGNGIQDLTYGLNDYDVAFFDVKAATGDYFDTDKASDFLDAECLPRVPVLYVGPWYKGLMEYFSDEQRSSLDAATTMEGFVVKPLKERTHWKIGRVILKAINPTYLVRKGGTERK